MAHTNYEQLRNKVEKRINQEPAIADPSRISVRAEKVGWFFNRHPVVILEGKISSESEGALAAEVARAVLGNSNAVEIENRLVVPLI
ncbi:MAG: hypothetical protein ABR590_08930 [Spirochaetia bacterium]